MKGVALDARGLTKSYLIGKNRQTVLQGVDFNAYHGQVTMVMGPSGSGKSTLIAALSGLMRPDAGEVMALGENLWGKKPRQIDQFRLDHCGFIFQGFNLFPALNATQQIMQVLKYCRLDKHEARRRAEAALQAVGLGARMSQRPAELSGGENQRVAIARALAMRPRVLCLDEVTSALDPELVAGVLDVLRDIARTTDITMLCVTHEMSFARDISDRVLMFDKGRIVESGPPDKIFSDPDHERTRDFLSAVL